MEFTFEYKKYTPFSFETVKHQRINHSNWNISKHGDIMTNLFLFYEGIKEPGLTWTRIVNSIQIFIGENLLFDYPVKYLVSYYHFFMPDTFSKSNYTGTEYFLNIPIPKIPLCALALQDIRIVAEFVDPSESDKISCYSEYVYLSDDDKDYLKNTPHDIFFHQLQKRDVSSDSTIKFSHPVKFIYSDDVRDVNKIIVDGHDYDIPINQHIYTCPFVKKSSKKILQISSGIPNYSVSTCSSIDVFSYIFPRNGQTFIVKFDANRQEFKNINFSGHLYTYSVSDGSFVYACSETRFIKIKNGSTSITEERTLAQPVDIPFAIVNGRFIFGQTFVYDLDNNSRTLYNQTGTFFAYAYSDEGTNIKLISTAGNSQADFNTISKTLGIVTGYTPTGEEQLLENTSASVTVDDIHFYAPLKSTDPFIAGDELIYINTACSGIVYGDNGKLYIIPKDDISLLFSYDAFVSGSVIFKFFWAFCKDTSSREPSGSVNFSRIRNVIIPNVTSGTFYAVNYNILHVENGISSVLYAT